MAAWCGSTAALEVGRISAGEGADNRLSTAPITALAGWPGSLWIATDGAGLDRLTITSGEIAHYTSRLGDPDSLSSDAVTAMTRSQSGALWIGTRHGGLDQLDPVSGQVTHFTVSQGRSKSSAGRAIMAIVEGQDGDLWLSVTGGLVRFDPQLGTFTFQASGSSDTDTAVSSALVQDAGGHSGRAPAAPGCTALTRLGRLDSLCPRSQRSLQPERERNRRAYPGRGRAYCGSVSLPAVWTGSIQKQASASTARRGTRTVKARIRSPQCWWIARRLVGRHTVRRPEPPGSAQGFGLITGMARSAKTA
jgi:hypothetical protein